MDEVLIYRFKYNIQVHWHQGPDVYRIVAHRKVENLNNLVLVSCWWFNVVSVVLVSCWWFNQNCLCLTQLGPLHPWSPTGFSLWDQNQLIWWPLQEPFTTWYWFKIPGKGDVASLHPVVGDTKVWAVFDLKEVKSEESLISVWASPHPPKSHLILGVDQRVSAQAS